MLFTERLLLSKNSKEDYDRYVEIYSDPQTNLYNPAGPLKPENAKAAFEKFISHWDNYNIGSWTITEKETNKIVGFGGLSMRKYGEELKLNVGFRFAKEAWGKGYATELTTFAIEYAFNKLKARKVFAIVRPDHDASIKVLKKCRMINTETLNDVPGKAESLVFEIENKSS